MSDRFFGKVVSTIDGYTIVMNKGSDNGVKAGDKFLIVSFGDTIVDPDTQEELERLEIVKGQVSVTHVQQKISTARSCEYKKSSDRKEIKKVTSRGGGLSGFLGPQDTVTESITPGETALKQLDDARVGDLLLKL